MLPPGEARHGLTEGEHMGTHDTAADHAVTPFERAARRVAAGGDHHAEAGLLVAAMTLEEKLGCLDGDLRFWPGTAEMISGAYHTRTWPAARVERLGVPGIEFADGPRGCVIGPATAFPVSMARGASFDPALEERIGDAIGAELAAHGATYTGAVCCNLLRHPAWGRAQETYGEDPHHVGRMAVALTRGLQHHVMACMKHFALNSMENSRFRVDVRIDERALHEVYLPHFRAVAEAGVASVMSAYNSMNGEWCGENATLLRDILRDEWGWDGFVTSDFTFGLRDACKSVDAGLNIEMPFRQQRAMVLPAAAAAGELDLDVVDALVAETVATLLRFADRISAVTHGERGPAILACDEHRALAYEAAVSSITLVRNEDQLLPVDPASVRRVAVLGRLARVPNLGDHGSSNVYPPAVITPLDGIRSMFEPTGAAVDHSDDDPTLAAGADLVVVVVGFTKHDEGEYLDPAGLAKMVHLFPPMDHPELGFRDDAERDASFAAIASAPAVSSDDADGGAGFTVPGGDRASLRLRPEHEELIAAACAQSSKVVVCVMGGSAVVMPWLADTTATLVIWYPGMEGGRALADVLTGVAEPGGRLPFAVPVDEADLVPFDRDADVADYGLLHGQWWLDANGVAAHLPFGFGLGYTTWELTAASVASEAGSEPGSPWPAVATVTVTNTGTRDGATVIQVFAAVPGSNWERPAWRLVGFDKVRIPCGGAEQVAVALDLSTLDIRHDGAWTREDAPVRLRVALHAGDAGIELTTAP